MKKRVFISGITGVMGAAGLRHLLGYGDAFELVSIVLDTAEHRRIVER